MIKIPKGYQLVQTADGSSSLYSSYFDENCHSIDGALNETLHNYWQGCQVDSTLKEFANTQLLEVGFGTGMGIELTVHKALPLQKPLFIYSTEIDENLILYAIKYSNCPLIQKLEKKQGHYHSKDQQFELTVLLGNALTTVRQIARPIHIIYQDPFSPKKNPHLWSVEWFELLKQKSHPQVKMATYCASARARKSMQVAGWQLQKLKGFARKKWATLAQLKGQTDSEIEKSIQSEKIRPIYLNQLAPFEFHSGEKYD